MKPTVFEDLRVGMVCEVGSELFAEGDIIEFGRLYDPQPMHTDPNGAAGSPTGGLIASGWQTASVAMKMLAAAPVFGIRPILGIGVDELRWPAPVSADDVISGRAEIVELHKSASKNDRGVVKLSVTLRNQAGLVVLSMKPMMLVRCGATASSRFDEAGIAT